MICSRPLANQPRRQRGAMLLVSVTLLLTLISLVTMHTGRVKSLEYKIILNNQNYVQAMAAARGGLAHGMTLATQDVSWQGETRPLILGVYGRASVSAEFLEVARNSLQLQLVQVTANGFSRDGLASVTLSEQGLRYPLVAVIPSAPFMSAEGLSSEAGLQLAANPNGGGPGIPISVWAGTPIELSDTEAVTCSLQAFDQDNCAFERYSGRGQTTNDIVDEELAFPKDLFRYLFNIAQHEWPLLKTEADLQTTNCTNLPWQQARIIWVTGHCSLKSGDMLGTPDSPVVLIVDSGNLSMTGNSMISGLVVMFRPDNDTQTYSVFMQSGAYVSGTLVANNALDDEMSYIRVRYHLQALTALLHDPKLQRLARVPGSWRDF